MATRTRKSGEFCWVNMLTPQPAEARAFFGKLLGWTYVEMPGMGHRVQVGGRDVAGIFDLAGPNTPSGTPPHIGGLVKIASADATCEQVTSLGGKAKPAFDIVDALRPGSQAVSFFLTAPPCAPRRSSSKKRRGLDSHRRDSSGQNRKTPGMRGSGRDMMALP